MALPIATALHSGPLDTPGEQAYLYARSGIARSATTRSNYVSILTSIDWIVRDTSGNIISTTDISDILLLNTLHITQALNDEPDTCSFTLKPQEPPAAIPQVGQEIRIAWAPGGPPLFHGYIVTSQSDWRLLNEQPPWRSIQCQDPMWRFDARIVTYRFPAQSVSASIAFLVQWFCNLSQATHPLNFSTAFVQADMPAIPAFDVVNQRPSTVMRTLTASVGGGFYIEGLTVHAWAGSVSEPLQSNPTPLTVGLSTLHAFRRTDDATQVRRAVIVEGRRTESLVSLPTTTPYYSNALGLGVADAGVWPTAGPWLARVGTQWVRVAQPTRVAALGANPPQTEVAVDYVPSNPLGQISLKKMLVLPPAFGWIRVGNQYSRYTTYTGDPLAGVWAMQLAGAPSEGHPYATFTAAIPADTTVEWVDSVLNLEPYGLDWAGTGAGEPSTRSQPVNSPVVVLARAQTTLEAWPPLEGFVQDGRYSYEGAQARADADLANFRDPLVSVEWATDDLNALPGRSQVIALSSAAVAPPMDTTVTILRVAITFPLPTLPPRRICTGGIVKPSTFMDLVVTEKN